MRFFSVLTALRLAASGVEAAGCADKDPATSIALPGGECLSFHAAPGPAGAPLVVFLHGDGGGSIGSGHWESLTRGSEALAASAGVTFVVLVRPGYRGPGGSSSGEAKSNDDDYSSSNIRLAAQAVTALKAKFRATRVIVGGSSGGAASAALIMGRHPGTADAAWLNACPCQIQPWRAWRAQSAGRSGNWSSLSPDENISGIAPGARFAVVVGDKDNNTLPKFSEAYVAALKARGIAVSYTLVPGAGHGNAWRTPEAAAALATLVR
jgi:pimeloyl-ACP methyl ester carboxylesterase